MTDVSSWSATDAANIGTLGLDLGEGTALISNGNNADRAIMGAVRRLYDLWSPLIGTITGKQAASAILSALSGAGAAADTFPYYTGGDTASRASVTAFGRTLLAQPDATAVRNTLGVAYVSAVSLGNPGYVRFTLPGIGNFQVAWGTCTIAANTTTSVSYAAAFPTASFAVLNAGRAATGAQDNDPYVQTCTTSGFTAFSASDTSNSGYYVACGY